MMEANVDQAAQWLDIISSSNARLETTFQKLNWKITNPKEEPNDSTFDTNTDIAETTTTHVVTNTSSLVTKINKPDNTILKLLTDPTVENEETTSYPPQKTHRGGCLPLTTTMHDLEDKVNVKDGVLIRLLSHLDTYGCQSSYEWRIRRLCLPEDLAFHARRIVSPTVGLLWRVRRRFLIEGEETMVVYNDDQANWTLRKTEFVDSGVGKQLKDSVVGLIDFSNGR
nr:hypothetical protein [Tanacetum cinerariifolium]